MVSCKGSANLRQLAVSPLETSLEQSRTIEAIQNNISESAVRAQEEWNTAFSALTESGLEIDDEISDLGSSLSELNREAIAKLEYICSLKPRRGATVMLVPRSKYAEVLSSLNVIGKSAEEVTQAVEKIASAGGIRTWSGLTATAVSGQTFNILRVVQGIK